MEDITNKSLGFTLVELILVILLVGVLSAVAFPHFFDQKTYQQRGFYDEAARRFATPRNSLLPAAATCRCRLPGEPTRWTNMPPCTSGAFTQPVPGRPVPAILSPLCPPG